MKSFIKRGKPLRYHFQIVPKTAGGLKHGPGSVSVVCENGSKISYTEPCQLNANGHADFSSVMRMDCTIYKTEHMLRPKECTFKIQLIRQGHSLLSHESRRKTIAKAKLNLADYCSSSSAPAASDVLLPLHPHGTLTLSIRAVWLQHLQHDPRSSLDSSTADLSSMHSSNSFDSLLEADADVQAIEPPLPAGVYRTVSVDLDNLADYHQHATASSRQTAKLSSALTARYVAPNGSPHHQHAACPGQLQGIKVQDQHQQQDQHKQQQQDQQQQLDLDPAMSAPLPRLSAVQHGLGTKRLSKVRRHSFCVIEKNITPIQEEWEGHESTATATGTASSSMEHSCSSDMDAAAGAGLLRVGSGASSNAGRLLQHQQQQQQRAMLEDALAAVAAADLEAEEVANGRIYSSLSSWWPFNRDAAARGVTTDQLMRDIANSGHDAPKLQQLCRGLLCERNEWRFKATQWERSVQCLMQQVDQLQNDKESLAQQMHRMEAQLQQLQADVLVDKLVEAKLQLAQTEYNVAELQGQLVRERERSRQLSERLTSVQNLYDNLVDEHGAIDRPYASPAEQGEGLGHSLHSNGAAVPAGRRYSEGWGFAGLFKAGSFVSARSSSSTH